MALLHPTALSIIIPAFNEERYLPGTLASLEAARRRLREARGVDAEVIVVDNASTDRTAEVARAAGARVVFEPQRQIAAARNAGARAARGRFIVTCDADNRLTENILERIDEVLSDGRTLGGGVRIRPERSSARTDWIFTLFDVLARSLGLGFGVMFTDRETFERLGGFPETVFVGEDGLFAWALRREARRRKMRVVNLRDAWVETSLRKMDDHGVVWILWQHLKFIFAPWLLRRRSACPTWYAVRGGEREEKL